MATKKTTTGTTATRKRATKRNTADVEQQMTPASPDQRADDQAQIRELEDQPQRRPVTPGT